MVDSKKRETQADHFISFIETVRDLGSDEDEGNPQ